MADLRTPQQIQRQAELVRADKEQGLSDKEHAELRLLRHLEYYRGTALGDR